MISKEKIDEAFEFYNIDKSYKEKCYRCAEEINRNEYHKKSFKDVYETLYCSDFSKIKGLWEIKDINELFGNNINPFVTNLMIMLGYEFHKSNIKKYKLEIEQMNIHKKRIKECFENDLIYRKYNGIRISQMLWAVYFIRARIIEIGRLQYEYEDTKNNISNFHDLFVVSDGENCINDIINFVYGINECNDYKTLSEETTLQKKIKNKLLSEEKFYLGLGILK